MKEVADVVSEPPGSKSDERDKNFLECVLGRFPVRVREGILFSSLRKWIRWVREGGSMKTVQSAKQVRVLALSLGIILSGLAVSEPAEAAPIQVSFTGIVLGSNLALSPPFAIGQTMFGSFTLHEALIASNDDNGTANIARYNHPITGLSVTVGTSPSYVATFGHPNNHIEIRNNFDPPGLLLPHDSAQLVVNKLITGAPQNGFNPTRFDINLVDGTAGAFNSEYPTTVPSISAFTTTNRWRLVFEPGGQVVQGALTSLTAIPLPTAVILFGAGLIALVGLGAGSWRQKKNTRA